MMDQILIIGVYKQKFLFIQFKKISEVDSVRLDL